MTGRIAVVGTTLLVLAAATSAQTPRYDQKAQLEEVSIAPGPFEPTYESFAKGYKCPAWFRDAKLGFWAHWGPQCVPMEGDWYARNMYIQGSGQYEDHLKRFGTPSQHGYKEIPPLWKAEKWDPDRLMAMYKRAGARYFVSMGVHHDNFDDWNSKFNRWNAVMTGPKRDVVGSWQKAARKLGMHFGVSEHLGASFTWFQVAHGSDKTGPYAGVPYDGADPRNWDLYHYPALAGDTGWYSSDPRWHKEWFNRIRDLVDTYHPDLLYTDGGVPFGNEVGRSMIAHLYNTSAEAHGGKVEAVYTCKQESKGMWVEDLERGVMPGIRPTPWQTDTSIGDWFYNRNWKYRGADWVIHMLVDIVSKNGNLLVNIVQRPDGTLDPEAEQVLTEMTKWIAVNGEAIYGTRPWLVYGEGRVRARGGSFGEDYSYSASDIRFTTKGGTLYAAALGWPSDGKVTIRSLAKYPGVKAVIKRVTLLGHTGDLQFTHSADGLTVQLPPDKPCDYAVTLKITGSNLRAFKPELATPQTTAVHADAGGSFALMAEDAQAHGDQVKLENQGGQPNIGFWDKPDEWVSWKADVKQAGRFRVTASCAAAAAAAPFLIDVDGHKIEGTAPRTAGWDQFNETEIGTIDVSRTGVVNVSMRSRDPQSWKPINLRWVRLTPVR